eukprot:CAMPEP_0119005596 /NCGR_PEP_ID=MMETSP1176-20130426/1819_1 /TAXON_ID=265551 /ORGANISM="Synedropsis recta cf, Strain CCMP1620" /LENGTH=563 /DNA_ID=CAMNT_0006957427 /DNA_START=134 /DNA_END=1825 /DNA_ORIENTATION=+
MSAAVLSPLPMNTSAEQYDHDDIMMNLFESAPSPAAPTTATATASTTTTTTSPTTADDASIPSLSEDDVDMEDVSPEISGGGLRNLGNTCYLNSATQMLASLDHFTTALAATDPCLTMTDDNADNKLKLRQEFIQLMTSLRSGETVHPTAFKKAVDKRSPLFVGYRQQDAHEFLTTLLDLLDEVYQAPESTSNDSNDDDDAKESENKPESTVTQEQTPAMETDATTSVNEGGMSRIQSFSELKVNEISNLLHGNDGQKKLQETTTVVRQQPVAKSNDEPHCKLIGGRAVVTDAASAPSLIQASDTEASMSSMSLPPSAATETRPAAADNNTNNNQLPSTSPSTPIDDYFCTEVRSRLTCDSCKYSRSQMEKYLHLSIDIADNSSSSGGMEEGLRKFFAPERREIKCEKCFCESATQSTEITKLPPALLFHFKRFIVDVSPDYSSVTYRKNQSSVEFSERLSLDDAHSVLKEFMADDVTVPEPPTSALHFATTTTPSYQIRSIVNHIGSSASCGHYTADGNRLTTGGDRTWTRFNDSIVTSITPEEAMGKSTTKTAYMVLYELQ